MIGAARSGGRLRVARPTTSSKFARKTLAAVAHQELVDEGVGTIATGLPKTPGIRTIVRKAHIENTAAAHAGGRIGNLKELVALTIFLCGETV